MTGHANLIEQAVQLADDGGDLLGEVAGVHGGCRPASGVVGRVCTVTAQCSVGQFGGDRRYALRRAIGRV